MAIIKSICEYKITATGKQNEVEASIPINHRYVIPQAIIRANGADDGYELWIEVGTYKDGDHTILLINDLLPKHGLTFDLGATLPTKSLQSIVKTQLESWITANIGEAKWEEIAKEI